MSNETQAPPWHSLDVAECATNLETNPADGLNLPEAEHRLTRYGPNKLAEKKPRSAWLNFLDQFKNVMVLVLIGAAVLAGAIGEAAERLARIAYANTTPFTAKVLGSISLGVLQISRRPVLVVRLPAQ